MECVSKRISDSGADHVVRGGVVSVLVDPADSPHTLLRVAIFEREILSDDDVGPVAATNQRRADTTLRTSGSRLDDAPRLNRSLEEFVRLETRDGCAEVLWLHAAAASEEYGKNEGHSRKHRTVHQANHSAQSCPRSDESSEKALTERRKPAAPTKSFARGRGVVQSDRVECENRDVTVVAKAVRAVVGASFCFAPECRPCCPAPRSRCKTARALCDDAWHRLRQR